MHSYVSREESKYQGPLVRWRDFGSETLRPELFVEVTDVRRAQVSELRSLDFAALLRHRHRTRPPARKVRMGKKYERTRFLSEKRKEKEAHHQIIAQRRCSAKFHLETKWFVTLGLAKESFTMSRHGDHIQWLSFSAAMGNAIWKELRGEVSSSARAFVKLGEEVVCFPQKTKIAWRNDDHG